MTINLKYLFVGVFILSGLLYVTYFDRSTPVDVSKIYFVNTCEGLHNINNDLNGIYILTADIDCRGYKSK